MSGLTLEECSTYFFTNSLEMLSWKQTKDKITITLKPPPGTAKAEKVNIPTNDDPKSKLNQFCQKKCRTLITKNDVVYTVENTTNENGLKAFQATVTLACLDSISFAGQICNDKKTAEKSAAQEALNHYADDTATFEPPAKKQKTVAAGVVGAVAAPANTSGKSMLNMMLAKILKKPLSKTDVTYESEQIQGVGFQVTVQLPCLPDEWSSKSWSGEAAPKKSDAEHSAAAAACEDLKAYPM